MSFTNINSFNSISPPLQIPGCAFWLDAADSSTLVLSGSNVIQWNDKSGNSFNATQGISSNQPVYLSNGVYIGTTSFLNTSYTAVPASETIFYVFRYTGFTSGVEQELLAPTSNFGRQFFLFNNQLLTARAGQVGLLNAGNTSINTTTIAGSTYNSSSILHYLNGSNVGSNVSTPGFSGGSLTVIGNRQNATQGLNGFAYEIVIYNNVLSVAQRQYIEGYLAWKWGTNTSLISTNPYRVAAPYNFYNFITNFTTVPQTQYQAFSNSPTQIPGLALWLDAADQTTLFQDTAGTIPVTTAGSRIQLWRDKSGSNNNATYSQSNIVYNTTFNGSYPSVSFPGTQTTGFSLSGALLPNGNSDASYFFVMNKPTVTSSQVFFTHGGGTQLKQFYASATLTIDRSGVGLINDSVNIANANIIVSCTQTSLAGGVNGWRNGIPFTTNGATNVWAVNSTAAWLGSGSIAGTSFIYYGYISEVLVYNRALSVSERQQVEGYLAWKWRLNSNLPGTHSYYTGVYNNYFPQLQVALPSVGPTISYQPQGFSPLSVPGLALWLDAADQTTVLLSGSTVTQWNDKSGNNRNATPSNSPTYTGSSIDLRNGSRFTGPLSISAGTLLTTSFCVAVSPATFNVDTNRLLSAWSGTTNDFQAPTGFAYAAILPSGVLYAYRNVGANMTSTIGSNVLFMQTTITFSNGSFFTSLNGNYPSGNPLSYGSNINAASTNLLTNYFIGSTNLATAQRWFGQVNEIIIFNRSLSQAEYQQVEGYLAWKWGLTGRLPSGHPNQYMPP